MEICSLGIISLIFITNFFILFFIMIKCNMLYVGYMIHVDVVFLSPLYIIV